MQRAQDSGGFLLAEALYTSMLTLCICLLPLANWLAVKDFDLQVLSKNCTANASVG